MVQRVTTVAFEGVEVRPVDVQVQVAPGMPAFTIVGLPDKAVSEARERVRSAMIASGLALPARRITINLAPADLPKEGSHYDLPIALGLMAAIGAIPHDALSGFAVLGELGDGSIAPVAGVLPAAIGANARGEGLICPAKCGPEAAWASPEIEIIAAASLIQLANHFKGTQVLSRPQPKILEVKGAASDLADHQGPGKRQARARSGRRRRPQSSHGRAAGRRQIDAGGAASIHPAAASRRRSCSKSPWCRSIAGVIEGGALTNRRPFRAPHHSASMPALAACMRGRARFRSPITACFPRRAAGIPASGARFAAPAAGNRRGVDRTRQSSRHLSGALHAGSRDEFRAAAATPTMPAIPAGAGPMRAVPPIIRHAFPAR